MMDPLRRKIKRIVIILTVFVFSMGVYHFWPGYQALPVLAPKITEGEGAYYKINAVFEEESMGIKAHQELKYLNKHEQTLENIYLHLYPNTFKSKEQAPFEKEEIDRAYPNGFNPGWVEILSVKEGKNPTDHLIMGTGGTILRVTPKKPLAPGESMNLSIEFEVKLPNAIGRMGYSDSTVNITNWYPILSVYDKNGWNLDPYYPIGDPFYSEVATYEITLMIPTGYELATTGNVMKQKEDGNMKTYEIEAKSVRDFAMVISRFFEVQEAKLGETKILSYSINGLRGEEALQYGVDSLEIFNRLFGVYPYDQLSIVAADFFIGGMEYPNLVMIGRQLYEMEEKFPLEYVVVHEVAHQWWYGIVGNNEITEPWLDEALTEYSTLMYFEEKYGPHIKEQIFEKMIKAQYHNFTDFEPDKGEGILRSLKEFDSSWEYSSIVYSKGAMFVEELREHMGDEAFMTSMREYFLDYQFKNATTEDFFVVCQRNTSIDLRPLFTQWLEKQME
ncbi:Peptidase M1, membrane alanine aminopeptidase-like protein [Alkaliphilus metalliredigens QYMF]|uniref:Peptidase M1, membrane alanine aminopeptidase-like protein n=1 Tax=Alkaliphilus metalliredigens (strain QYMF) TaxID=293826 RepID=A6TXB0_ALKMQ|nr:M1 family metallopeptidase [Alkaliphilus metalliredigens]ABR50828.1 Peptidase M1, membrane alanine aminopeptidase-like protein [Alkaliphilus metalliredigens QYMF]